MLLEASCLCHLEILLHYVEPFAKKGIDSFIDCIKNRGLLKSSFLTASSYPDLKCLGMRLRINSSGNF